MLFSYTARDKSGKEVSGTIEATSKLEAADKIFNEKNLTVISLEKTDAVTNKKTDQSGAKKAKLSLAENATKIHIGQAEASQKSGTIVTEKKKIKSIKDILDWLNDLSIEYSSVSVKDKVIFFRLLSVMINAGLPIIKALLILRDQTKNPKLQKILVEVSESVEHGDSLSTALAEYPEVFSDAEIGIITAGEVSGQLNEILINLASETEKNANLKGKIKSAMIYPIVILTILIGVMIVVMTLVIPKMAELFTGAGVDLPATTQFLINLSSWFVGSTLFVPNWLLFILTIVGFFLGVGAWKKTKTGKYLWDRLMLKLPIFGELNMKVALTGFSRQLSSLSASGVSIIRALEIVASAVGNEVYRRRILEVKEEVERGIPIHEAIANDKLFPNLITSMIAVGEQTAQLDTVTKKVADFYEEEVDTFVKNLSTIMEPFIIVVVGILVGGLVAAIMQPIMQIADVASQG